MRRFVVLQLFIIAAAFVCGIMAHSKADISKIPSADHISEIQKLKINSIECADNNTKGCFEAFNGNSKLFDESYEYTVFICKAQDKYTFSNEAAEQYVTVEKNIVGSYPKTGSSIKLVSSGGIKYETSSQMRMRKNNGQEKSDINEKLFMLDLDGANLMQPDHRYLVVCMTKQMGLSRHYGTFPNQICWLDLENTKSTPLENSYAENIYTKYSDNEFFCINQDNIDLLYENKKAVLEKYDDLY